MLPVPEPEHFKVSVAPEVLSASRSVSTLKNILSSVVKERANTEPVEAAVTLVPALLTKSAMPETVNATASGVSLAETTYDADQLLLLAVEARVTELVTATPPEVNATVGLWMISEDVNVRVTVSPVTALVVSALLETMVTEARVGRWSLWRRRHWQYCQIWKSPIRSR